MCNCTNTRSPSDTPVDFTKYPVPTLDNANFGEHVKKTMYLLSSSTAEKPNKIRIAFTGQSIVDPNNTWPASLTEWLRQTYPTADIIAQNFAIGGFATEFLRKRMPNDITSFYPDLVICYVSGHDTYYEEMVRYIRENTMAEMMIHTSHLVTDPEGYEWAEYMSYKRLPEIAQKYGAQMCDTRTPWKNFLLKNLMTLDVLLYDTAHLNASGQQFMLELMKQFFVLKESNAAEDIQAQYIPISTKDWQGGKLTVPFTGNRVELVYGDGQRGKVNVRINGQKPSEIREAYIRTKENNSMWSTIGVISYKKVPGEQVFTVTVNDFTDAQNFSYTVEGAETGLEGASNTSGILNGNYLYLTDMSFIFHPGADNPTPGQLYTFQSLLNGTDTHDGSNPYTTHPEKSELFDPMMLISGILVGKHILELTAESDIPDIKAIKVYNPNDVI